METRKPPASATPFEFHGSAGEYFGIWAVNLCLTVLSLGLYAPWAKVRQKRYFYGSTRLAGASFDYLANPVAMLKGRLAALALVLVLGAAAEFQPLLKPFLGVAFIAALPWLVIRGRRFNAVNTVYRNIRFSFDAPYGGGFLNFVALPFVILPLSLGLAYPWVLLRQKKFLVEHNAYGGCRFSLQAPARALWPVFLRLGLAAAALALLVALALAGLPGGLGHPAAGAVAWPPALLFFFVSAIYLEVAMSNLIWNNVSIGGINFRCQLGFSRMLSLRLTNAAGVAVSLGLLLPWAKVRLARYRLECLWVDGGGEALAGFAAGRAQAAGALGEELSDILDVDLGL